MFSVSYLAITPYSRGDSRTDRLALTWPSVSLIWPIIKPLNKKNNDSFIQSIQEIIQSRMALDKDAKHDFYSIAAGDLDTAEGLRSSELWAEANFILPAGEFVVHWHSVFSIIKCFLRHRVLYAIAS